MSLYKVEVYIPVTESQFISKVVYYFEAQSVDAAKARAVELYLKKTVPGLLAVSWEGPITVEKAAGNVIEKVPKKRPSNNPRTS